MSFLDLSSVKESEHSLLPAGKYNCSITNAELKDAKTGGQYIKIELTVSDGDSIGRKLWTQFNVRHSNPKVVEISLQQLKSLLKESGYATPDKLANLTDLNGLRVGVKTKIKTDAEYGDKAEVSYFTKTMASPSSAEPLSF